MRQFFTSRVHSFEYAFAGWWHVIRTQRNAWIHAVASILVFTLAIWLQIPPASWAVLLLTIGMVWMAEFFNTALEAIIDLVSPDWNPLAKVGKDVGAAAVLVAALCSVLIGLIILGPPLWQQIRWIFQF